MEMENDLKKKVVDFWNYFFLIEEKLTETEIDEKILDELDSRVLALGEFTWEIGPGKVKEYSFVISPAGNKELLTVSREIIESAPENSKWEFYPAVQIKDWDFFFSFYSMNGDKIELDASGWEYVLLEYPDHTFEIILKAENLVGFSEDDKIIASEIVLDGAIGEEVRIDKISYIEVVDVFESEYLKKASSIRNIEKHSRKIGLIS